MCSRLCERVYEQMLEFGCDVGNLVTGGKFDAMTNPAFEIYANVCDFILDVFCLFGF